MHLDVFLEVSPAPIVDYCSKIISAVDTNLCPHLI